MKLTNLILIQNETMAHFGEAKIVKTLAGKYKLVGGSEQDRDDAQNWIAMFCPEIVVEIVPAGSCGHLGLPWCSRGL